MADAQPPFAACLEFLAKRVPQHLKPKVGIVCGSGLSTLASSFTDPVYVPYGEIPGFGISTGAMSSKSNPSVGRKLIRDCSQRAQEQFGLRSQRRCARRGDVGEGKRLGVPYTSRSHPRRIDDSSSTLTRAMHSRKSCSRSELWLGWVLKVSSVSLLLEFLIVISRGGLAFDNSDKCCWIT